MKDTLQERIQSGINEILDAIIAEDFSGIFSIDLKPLENRGTVHEIIDGQVPIYTQEIKDLWYLHEDKFLEAYEGDDPRENDGMTAIFYYLDQSIRAQLEEAYEKLDEAFEEAWIPIGVGQLTEGKDFKTCFESCEHEIEKIASDVDLAQVKQLLEKRFKEEVLEDD